MRNNQVRESADMPLAVPMSFAPTAIWALALGTFGVGTDAFIVSAFLPEMANDLSISSALAGESVTVFSLAYALLAPLISTFTAALERKRLLVFALIFLGLANIATALASSFGALVAARIAAAYTPSAGAVAAQMVRPQNRARALSIVIGGLTAATALGIPMGRIISLTLDWRAALMLVGLLAFGAATALLVVMPRVGNIPQVSLRQRVALLRNRNILTVLSLTIIGMAACYVPYAFTVQVLQSILEPSESITRMLFFYGLGAMVGNYLSGWMTDRTGPVRVLLCAYIVMVISLGGLALANLWQTPPHFHFVIAVLMGLWGASSWSQSPAQQHRLIANAPKQAALVVALNSSAIYLGISAGTAIGSYTISVNVTETLTVGATLAVMALLCVLATAHVRATDPE